MYLILSKLGYIQFFNPTAGLTQLSRPKGVKIRWWPCIVHAEDRCKVKYYRGEVLITLVLVLDITPLTIIYIVAYIYSI